MSSRMGAGRHRRGRTPSFYWFVGGVAVDSKLGWSHWSEPPTIRQIETPGMEAARAWMIIEYPEGLFPDPDYRARYLAHAYRTLGLVDGQ